MLMLLVLSIKYFFVLVLKHKNSDRYIIPVGVIFYLMSYTLLSLRLEVSPEITSTVTSPQFISK